jgi:plasmid stabilization system protein ParE
VSVTFSSEASADLIEIGAWIAADSPARADTFLDALEGACTALSSNPSRFSVARIVNGEAVRKRVYRGYLIFYRIHRSRVEILRVTHGKRDWVALLSELER